MKIYKNLWAGYESYFIKFGQNKTTAYGYSLMYLDGKWELRKANYYSSSLKYDEEHFPVVGNIDLKKFVIEKLLDTLGVSEGIVKE